MHWWRKRQLDYVAPEGGATVYVTRVVGGFMWKGAAESAHDEYYVPAGGGFRLSGTTLRTYDDRGYLTGSVIGVVAVSIGE